MFTGQLCLNRTAAEIARKRACSQPPAARSLRMNSERAGRTLSGSRIRTSSGELVVSDDARVLSEAAVMGEGAETPASKASRRGTGTPSAIPPTPPHWRLSGDSPRLHGPRRRPGIGPRRAARLEEVARSHACVAASVQVRHASSDRARRDRFGGGRQRACIESRTWTSRWWSARSRPRPQPPR
jgi:hypothetical protein